jgi:branched-chain amino acid transport system permease protein
MTQLILLLLNALFIGTIYFVLLRKASWRTKLAAAGVAAAGAALLLVAGVALGAAVERMANSVVFFAIQAGLYALLALALNIHWGYTGLFNIGVAGFFAIGGYVSALLVHPPIPHPPDFAAFTAPYAGLPFGVGLLAATLLPGVLALLIGLITLRLRADFLAIATIGFAEILRLFVLNEQWLTEGPHGISGIPQPLFDVLVPGFLSPQDYNWFYGAIVLVAILIAFFGIERVARSPWGRVLKAIREDEDATNALGKNVFAFRLQALVVGAMVMGAVGALSAHFFRFIGPETFDPTANTFLIWVMLVVGGTGNNRGAIFGAFAMWFLWTSTLALNDVLPPTLAGPWGTINVQAQLGGPLRVMLIVIVLELMLLYRPQGVLGEEKQTSILISNDKAGGAPRSGAPPA